MTQITESGCCAKGELSIVFGDVRKKKINTPNDFVSHMLEHIAWRMGLSIDLNFDSENWQQLGRIFGTEIKKFPAVRSEAAALGMIDDGAAVVSVDSGRKDVVITALAGIDCEYFLGLRCEQIATGQPLVSLLEGLAEGVQSGISIEVLNLEDPHHTWEAIFRAVGIALSKIYTPIEKAAETNAKIKADAGCEKQSADGELTILEKGCNCAVVRRGTAETFVTVAVDFLSDKENRISVKVSDSISAAVSGIEELFRILTENLTAQVEIDFSARKLSSSHVVWEDIGLVFGRALLEILCQRMRHYGVNGAGSNLTDSLDAAGKNLRVGISVEGRKFLRIIPRDGDHAKLSKNFVIGNNVFGGIRTEDLDDFLDGLSGGLSASLFFEVKDYSDPQANWQELFAGLGTALHEAFLANPYRLGVPAGVKATLA